MGLITLVLAHIILAREHVAHGLAQLCCGHGRRGGWRHAPGGLAAECAAKPPAHYLDLPAVGERSVQRQLMRVIGEPMHASTDGDACQHAPRTKSLPGNWVS